MRLIVTGGHSDILFKTVKELFPEAECHLIECDSLQQKILEINPMIVIVAEPEVSCIISSLSDCKYKTIFFFIVPHTALLEKIIRLQVTLDFIITDIDKIDRKELYWRILKLYRLHKQTCEYSLIVTSFADQYFRSILEITRLAELKSGYDGRHMVRVAEYSTAIAKELGMNAEETNMLFKASMCHDIGKIMIPDYVLMKEDILTAKERDIVEQHTIHGKNILMNFLTADLPYDSNFTECAIEIAELHHENIDGSGYPYGLLDSEIPIMAKIVRIADVYDSLTSERPYKKAWPVSLTIQYLKESKSFDREIVSALESYIRRSQ